MDADFGQEDDFLGSALLSLRTLCDGRSHDLRLDLRCADLAAAASSDAEDGSSGEGGRGGHAAGGGEEGSGGGGEGSCGSVELSCRFLPFDQLLADGSSPQVDGQPLLASPGEVRPGEGIALARCWRAAARP